MEWTKATVARGVVAALLGSALLAGSWSALAARDGVDDRDLEQVELALAGEPQRAARRAGPPTAEEMARQHRRYAERLAAAWTLSEAQRERLVTLLTRLHEQRHPARDVARDPRAEMQALVAGDKFDVAKAQAWVDARAAALQAGSPALIEAAAAFYDSLQPAQQAQVREFMARAPVRGPGGHPGHRHGPHRGAPQVGGWLEPTSPPG